MFVAGTLVDNYKLGKISVAVVAVEDQATLEHQPPEFRICWVVLIH